MADLKMLFEKMGFDEVSTYIQSGNVLFSSQEAPGRSRERIEKALKRSRRMEARVFVLTSSQLQRASDHNPFESQKREKEQQCHLMFLSGKPEPARRKELMKLGKPEYRFAFWDKVFYYAYSRKFAGKRRTLNFERILGVQGTARTWKVVGELIKLSKRPN